MKPVLLEPIMNIEIECPGNYQGPITGDLNSRRGRVFCHRTCPARS
ncbi:MAG: hypothetical protein Ct9H300mP1_16820 [Planctomycetaceae bacterium]|nr:MAG: hypothetical protein Ct9H300mP1_16820 [Planctomycetaceae bacterium]